jgi:hypothetical protein
LLPIYRALLGNPRQELSLDYTLVWALGAVCLIQSAYWYRLLRVTIAIERPNIVLGHFVLFLGRLSFIFAAAIFSVLVFRRVPELSVFPPLHVFGFRSFLAVAVLFSLFCPAFPGYAR